MLPTHGRQTTPEVLAKDARGLSFPNMTKTPTKLAPFVTAATAVAGRPATDSPLFSTTQTAVATEERAYETAHQSAARKLLDMTSYGLSRTLDGFEAFFNGVASFLDITTPRYQMYIEEADEMGLNKTGGAHLPQSRQPQPISDMFTEDRIPRETITEPGAAVTRGSRKKQLSVPEMVV